MEQYILFSKNQNNTPQESGRHYFWANFKIQKKDYGTQIGTLMHGTRKRIIREAQIPELQSLHGFDLEGVKLKNKRQILRNCVIPELGKYSWQTKGEVILWK